MSPAVLLPLALNLRRLALLGGYDQQFTFLLPGTCSVAFTCQAVIDNPDQVDSPMIFSPSQRTSASWPIKL